MYFAKRELKWTTSVLGLLRTQDVCELVHRPDHRNAHHKSGIGVIVFQYLGQQVLHGPRRPKDLGDLAEHLHGAHADVEDGIVDGGEEDRLKLRLKHLQSNIITCCCSSSFKTAWGKKTSGSTRPKKFDDLQICLNLCSEDKPPEILAVHFSWRRDTHVLSPRISAQHLRNARVRSRFYFFEQCFDASPLPGARQERFVKTLTDSLA